MTTEALRDVGSAVIDLLYITPLLCTEAQNLSGLETRVIEQVGQAPLTLVGQHVLEYLPDLVAVGLVFYLWLACITWLWQRDFSWPRVGPQRIQNSPIQTCTQVRQRSTERLEYYLLLGGGLPEPFKGQRHVGLRTLQAAGRLPAGTTIQPAPHGLTTALHQ